MIDYNNLKEEQLNNELERIAVKENKTIEEVINNYKYGLKDLKYSLAKINSIIDDNNYQRFPADISINGYGKNNELESKYLCFDKIDELKNFKAEDIAIVTGFGPTSAPTAGTLSLIFKTIEMQRETGIYTHIIISDLSALNSRQMPLDELLSNSEQFISFIKKIGFDTNNGEIRTNSFLDHAITFSIISSVLTVNDFVEGEATDEIYKKLNILGNDFSTMVSQAYTVGDIVLPIIRDKKKAVIVPAGIEEHLYPYLARVVIERIKHKSGGINTLIDKDAKIGALYSKLIGGLFPYVKMSKSIKNSSINLGDTNEEVYEKIINCSPLNESIILQMITLASDWNPQKINEAKKAYDNRQNDYNSWLKYKKDYYEFFINIKKIWDESKPNTKNNTYDELFRKEQ